MRQILPLWQVKLVEKGGFYSLLRGDPPDVYQVIPNQPAFL
jgi:hypothetical protein